MTDKHDMRRSALGDLAVTLGAPLSYNTHATHHVHGDIWATAWSADESLYMLADDVHGFQGELEPDGRNIAFYKLEGSPPEIAGTLVNPMDEFGVAGELGVDGANWKGSGIAAIDGTLYLFASRQWYGLYTPGRREVKMHLYLFRSTDRGRTWTTNRDSLGVPIPLIPGPGFAAAYFVDMGRDGSWPDVDDSANWVYAVSTDGAWDNGDCMTLGRVPRDRLFDLNAGDWQFYRGGDGRLEESWGPLASASPIVGAVRRCSMTGMQYLAGLNRYLIMQWHYPTLDPYQHNTGSTVWEFYTGPHPWGPFTVTARFDWPRTGLYNPYLPTKYLTADSKSGTILASGDFQTHAEPWTSTAYTMHMIDVQFEEYAQ